MFQGTQTIETDRGFGEGVLLVLRDATRGALAGGILGVIVLGFGGRVVMRAAALIHPAATASFTENGNAIGTISPEGTIAVLLFGGLFFGLSAGVVWVAVAPWIPGHGLRRAVAAAPIAAALSSFLLVESGNPDFQILGNDPVVIAMLVGLIAIFGFALSLADDRLERTLPAANDTPRPLVIGYAVVVLLGAVLILPLTVSLYLRSDVCDCGQAPATMGVALLVTGGITLAWWMVRARGIRNAPASLAIAGRIALATAVAFGVLRLAEDVGRILGAG